jgi:hypothetical protein
MDNKSKIVDNIMNSLSIDYLDIAYGVNRAINGLSGGGLDYLGSKMDFDSQMSDYLSLFPENERNTREKLGALAEVGGTALSSNKLIKLVPLIGNELIKWNGKRGLLSQFKKGYDFNDVNLGRVSPVKLEKLNKIRNELEQSPIGSDRVTIPADRVEHIYKRRILGDGYSPEEAVETIYKALFGKNTKIHPDKKYNTLQHFVDSSSKPSNKAIIGKIRGGDNIFVKTGFKN